MCYIKAFLSEEIIFALKNSCCWHLKISKFRHCNRKSELGVLLYTFSSQDYALKHLKQTNKQKKFHLLGRFYC